MPAISRRRGNNTNTIYIYIYIYIYHTEPKSEQQSSAAHRWCGRSGRRTRTQAPRRLQKSNRSRLRRLSAGWSWSGLGSGRRCATFLNNGPAQASPSDPSAWIDIKLPSASMVVSQDSPPFDVVRIRAEPCNTQPFGSACCHWDGYSCVHRGVHRTMPSATTAHCRSLKQVICVATGRRSCQRSVVMIMR